MKSVEVVKWMSLRYQALAENCLCGSEFDGFALDQQADNETEQTQDGAEDFDDEDLDEPVQRLVTAEERR